jgi:exodeoxyribonuclease VII large subunit
LRAPRPQLARVTHAARALERAGRQRLAHAAGTLERLQNALELLNPGAVLERGYAIVTAADGAIVSDAGRLAPGDDVALRFARGGATATVNGVQPPSSGDSSSGRR